MNRLQNRPNSFNRIQGTAHRRKEAKMKSLFIRVVCYHLAVICRVIIQDNNYLLCWYRRLLNHLLEEFFCGSAACAVGQAVNERETNVFCIHAAADSSKNSFARPALVLKWKYDSVSMCRKPLWPCLSLYRRPERNWRYVLHRKCIFAIVRRRLKLRNLFASILSLLLVRICLSLPNLHFDIELRLPDSNCAEVSIIPNPPLCDNSK